MTRVTDQTATRPPPRIYQISPAAIGPAASWPKLARRVRAMNFDVLYVGDYDIPPSGNFGIPPVTPKLVAAVAATGMDLLLDADLAEAPRNGELHRLHPDWFSPAGPSVDRVALDWSGPHAQTMLDYHMAFLLQYLDLGVRGFRFSSAWMLPPAILQQIIRTIHGADPNAFCCADALGRPEADLLRLAGSGLDYVLNSAKWWDGAAPWFLQQQSLLRSIAPSIGFPANGFTEGNAEVGADERAASLKHIHERRYLIAASFSAGIMMPAGYEYGADFMAADQTSLQEKSLSGLDISDFIGSINRLKVSVAALAEDGDTRALSEPFQTVQGFSRRTHDGTDLAFVLINMDDQSGYAIDLDWLLASSAEMIDLEDLTPDADAAPLDRPEFFIKPGGAYILHAGQPPETEQSVVDHLTTTDLNVQPNPSRVVIEAVEPDIDGGRFAARRIVGDRLTVSADIFRDGHDQIAASLRLQEAGDKEWRTAPMLFVDNDRWAGSIPLTRIGRARYAVEAWTDRFQSWRLDLIKKRAAGQNLATDLAEGQILVREALDRSGGFGSSRSQRRLENTLLSLDQAVGDDARAAILLSEFTRHAVGSFPDKTDRQILRPLEVEVEREEARFAAWYEMFPRSQGTVAGQSASFADCIKRLPEIRSLGFDVLYLVPIHPIGRVNRKGRHNSLTAGPGDPGSPYAIGSDAGGHDAIDPELGTLEDFRAFQREVRAHGMELALDFAVQCAPDHPWVDQHPDWFRRRPDGTIKFAENPPKKYEDIVNIDFECADWKAVWHALRDVILFWVAEGVRIFRIDNPHTKPVPFWEWLIAEVKQQNPDILFLAEAFTRPKMMRRLAKVGFTQSYSYFTWRNTKAELTEYLVELTTGPSRDYMQPNFFANTPDILPVFLQTGGRAGFRIRAALAATLSPVYGIYNGFELCEATALPGREEYADSEKYTYKVWDWDRPGNIKDDLIRLNRLRRESPALRLFTNLIFAEASHPEILFYAKISADGRDTILVAINLNPVTAATTELAFPFEAMGLTFDGSFETQEVFTGERRHWQGPHHTIVLDPAIQPTMILRRIGGVSRKPSETDYAST